MSRYHQRLGRPWQYIRRRALELSGFRCQRCQRPGRLEVHHRTALRAGGAAYDLENLEVLCRECHLRASGFIPVVGAEAWWRRLERAIR